MTISEMQQVMNSLNSPYTNFKEIVEFLVNNGVVSFESLHSAISSASTININGIDFTLADYNKYVHLNKTEGVIPAIKAIRLDRPNLDLKSGKAINDVIKERENI